MSLEERIEACRRCSLGNLRKRAVPGWLGPNAGAPLLGVMCEAPGAQEDETGRPLVGRAGQMFDRLLEQAGIDRSTILIMNRVRCRPPNNQLKNYPDAVEACDEWTKEELKFYNPAVVLLMGASAIGEMFGARVAVGEVRGTVRATTEEHDYGARLWVPTYHPASLVRPTGRGNIGLVLADMLLAKDLLRQC